MPPRPSPAGRPARERTMRITDLTLTLFGWTVPQTTYGHALVFGGERELAAVRVQTDEGVEGHSFLGSSSRGAEIDAGPLLTYLKPLLLGENPLDIRSEERRVG